MEPPYEIVPPGGEGLAGRQPVQVHREDVDPDQAQDEDRGRGQEDGRGVEPVVELGVLADGGDDADRDADPDRQRQREAHEHQGLRQAGADLVDDRPARRDREAEVALQDVAQPRQVLVREDRLVEAEPTAFCLEQLGVGQQVGQDLGVDRGQERVAGRQLERDEPDDRDPEQDRDRDEHAPQDVGAHRASYARNGRQPVGASRSSGRWNLTDQFAGAYVQSRIFWKDSRSFG